MHSRRRFAFRGRHRALPGMILGFFLLLLVGGAALAQGPIQDDGNLFSAQARQQAAAKSAQIQQQTGKVVAVRTVDSLNGQDINAAADATFRQMSLNGVLIFATRAEHKLAVKVGTNTRQAISQNQEAAIRDDMVARFRANDFDGGLLDAMDRIGADLRAAPATSGQGRAAPDTAPAPSKSGGSNFGWLVPLLLIGGLIALVMLFFRRNQQRQVYQRGMGPGYGPGYNQGYGPGYGPGYGGGRGGGILGGLLGGIGGSIIGNSIYDRLRGNDRGGDVSASGGDYGAFGGNDYGQVSDSPADTGDWGGGSDSGASVGDWGSGDSSSS